jgi:hypothetical protein
VELKMAGSIRSRKKYGGHARNPERTPPRLLKLLPVKVSAGYAKVAQQTIRRATKAG